MRLPSSVLYIRYQAFDQAYMLESIEIGEKLIEIHDQAFVNDMNAYGHAIRTCKKMKEFIVAENNEKFSAVEGVLFNKEKTELIFYPNAKSKEYIIPKGITSIRQRAFSACDNLFSIEIPESMTFIGRSAFENCKAPCLYHSVTLNINPYLPYLYQVRIKPVPSPYQIRLYLFGDGTEMMRFWYSLREESSKRNI